jgi:hypothetical protein
MKNSIITLIEETTITGAGPIIKSGGCPLNFHAAGVTSSGAGSVTLAIQGSNLPSPSVDTDWKDLGTISLTLSTTRASDSFGAAIPWINLRAKVTAISGTGAKVSAYVCEAR